MDPKEKADRKRAYAREKAREWRRGVRERKLAGTLTSKDLRSFDLLKARKRKYNQNHKESLAKYFREYQKNHLDECAARSKKWRLENLEKARQADKRYRETNAEQIRINKARSRLKKKQNDANNDRSAEKQR
ncbi:uncharacterized protein FA14DRAFT_181020 [Meira miltonrushii]|uniref:Uncharacterized protein n=1 Tax=Meira miltonrushii TaxID=1280837 RepID=A0A316VAV7_9BASI|nr:uncharacterized protein FA14DRAFT_181020 [Meira miltonrushii]PWN34394.1 hypothetical protein FA14DRAFT_181020 [Meira miltonrushii]